MAFRPVLSVPKWRALAVAAIVFLALYALANWALKLLTPAVGVPLFLGIFVASGAVAGYIARRSPLMHGAILGAFSGVLAFTYVFLISGNGLAGMNSLITSAIPVVTFTALPGIALCSLGTVLGDYLRGRRARGL
jgi:hypothetical protein